MKSPPARCKCLHCKKLFAPDYRNRGRQKYCSAIQCQAASKRGSQARWLSQPENHDYFHGPENVKRVQQWRQNHPGYWKGRPRKPRRTLQETCSEQVAVAQELIPKEAPQVSRPALQELCEVHPPPAGGPDRAIYRHGVTRGHRRPHPAFDSQRAGHSGSTFQETNERKHCL